MNIEINLTLKYFIQRILIVFGPSKELGVEGLVDSSWNLINDE